MSVVVKLNKMSSFLPLEALVSILGIQQHSSLYQFATIIFLNTKRGAPRGVEGGGAQGGVQGGQQGGAQGGARRVA